MTATVFHKLLAIFLTVGAGWVIGRMRWLDSGNEGGDPARLLGNIAFYLFVPALLFRTTARLDFSTMPWPTVVAYFVPSLVFLFGVYAWQRLRRGARVEGAAAPSVRAIAATFGNSVQVGIPLATALYGEAGLAIHIALVSLHAIILLTVLTALAELDVARHGAVLGASRLWATLRQTLRNTIVHPVVLPVLAGLAWNATGWPLPGVADEALSALGSAVVPVCLVLIGLTLAYHPLRRGGIRGALGISALKLIGLPAVVFAFAYLAFHLRGLPLSVAVLMAALPVGSNALIFSQRYDTLQAETTAAIMVSTVTFAGTAALWLALLAAVG